jgi:preprotein translocase subunit SecA
MFFLGSLFKHLAGRHHRKFVAKCRPVVARINEIEVQYQALTDEQLRAKTAEFRERIQKGEEIQKLLPEAFAAVKNAARRLCGREIQVCGLPLTWNMVHFDVQLIGGIALAQRYIAEMATGEGKTLVASLPTYLYALAGKGAHVVTVNDYLARRDAEWIGALYNSLGLTVGCIQQSMPPQQRREAYACDITYGTASEYGFDYLRDNGLALRAEDQVQRGHFFCLVDEVDSILIDEARTPLIISGPAPIDREMPFPQFKPAIERLFLEQTRLLNQFAVEAETELKKERGDLALAATRMWQIKTGAPKHKQLFRLLEDGRNRTLLDKRDLELHADVQKQAAFALKEELFFTIDEKQHTADLTEKGRLFLRPDDPDAFVMPDLASIFVDIERREDLTPEEKEKEKERMRTAADQTSETIHAISQLLKAYALYERDNEYIVADGKVVIVDEQTHRPMPGRRWSDGLHQAVEAKEGVAIERETRTYATITIQNYFRLYTHLAGMTGTAETEATEFNDIYKLGVMVIPTNRKVIRKDENDVIYKTRNEKFKAVLEEIRSAHATGQPVLVGTGSVEASEFLGRLLRNSKIPHTILNAKQHQQEAEVVARAGQRGAVTISTNMAGRGTDIRLGEGVSELGGLYVIGTERHESRRVDRQLRGRAGRQGDPGRSKFYISLEDNLMRLFANAGAIGKMMQASMVDGEPLEHPWLNRSIETAQKRVEQQNYAIRKRLLQYDDVLNKQREIIYSIRNEALWSKEPRKVILELVDEELSARLEKVGVGSKSGPQRTEVESLIGWLNVNFPLNLKPEELVGDGSTWKDMILERINKAYEVKQSVEAPEAMIQIERFVLINAIDFLWQGHLTEMEDLRRSVGLRSYGQKDPLNEYKSEAYAYFEQLMGRVRERVCAGMFRSASSAESFQAMLQQLGRLARTSNDGQPAPAAATPGGIIPPQVNTTITGAGSLPPAAAPRKEVTLPKVELPKEMPKGVGMKLGRNDPCPLDPAKKFKNCCGKDGSKVCWKAGLK